MGCGPPIRRQQTWRRHGGLWSTEPDRGVGDRRELAACAHCVSLLAPSLTVGRDLDGARPVYGIGASAVFRRIQRYDFLPSAHLPLILTRNGRHTPNNSHSATIKRGGGANRAAPYAKSKPSARPFVFLRANPQFAKRSVSSLIRHYESSHPALWAREWIAQASINPSAAAALTPKVMDACATTRADSLAHQYFNAAIVVRIRFRMIHFPKRRSFSPPHIVKSFFFPTPSPRSGAAPSHVCVCVCGKENVGQVMWNNHGARARYSTFLRCYYNTGGTAEGGDIIFPLERSFIRSHLLLYPPTPGSAIEESDKRELLEDSSGLLSGKIVAVGEK